MKRLLIFAIWTLMLVARAGAPSAPELFPQDTLALFTVPDWNAARTQYKSGSFGRLWADPSMKPFRDKVEAGFKEQVLGDLEKQLGIKADDYLSLLQGQISFAVVENDWNIEDDKTTPAVVLVLDTKDKSGELKTRLAEVRQKLADSKKPLKTEKIRDLEFSTVTVEPKDKSAKEDSKGSKDEDSGDKKSDTAKSERPQDWTFGQVDNVLVVGNSVKSIEKVVARLTGGNIPQLADATEFQNSTRTTAFKDALFYAWYNVESFTRQIKRAAAKASGTVAQMGMEPGRVLTASGLEGVKAIGMASFMTAEGEQVRLTASLPEGQRTGLFKMLYFQGKDSGPTSFAPSDAISFRRWRLDGKKTWENLESMIQQISPQLGGLLQISLSTLGKEKDPGFDFRKSFVSNLGDDYVAYQKAPREKTLAALQDAPELTLISSPDPAQLALGLKAAGSLLPSAGDGVKEREFNGRHIYGLKLPSKDGGDDGKLLEISPGAGYVAISTDPAILEQYLRSGESDGKSLKENAAIRDAAQKVGGMSTGLFGYQDGREGLRLWWEVLRQSGGLDKLGVGAGDSNSGKKWTDWVDVSLLPPFESISKYLGMSVYAGKWDGAGFSLQGYWPVPN